jgi:hypothetical protein
MEDKITLVNAGCGFDGYVSIEKISTVMLHHV